LACDTEKISGLPTRNRATRPGRQYTNPFRLPASREAANGFQNVQCHEDLYPREIVSRQTNAHPPDTRGKYKMAKMKVAQVSKAEGDF
jgi:hypothetical protein